MTTGQCCGTCKFFMRYARPSNLGQCDAPVPDVYDHRGEYPIAWTADDLGIECEAWTQIEVQKVAP